MSNEVIDCTPAPRRRYGSPKLEEAKRRAIVASIAEGRSRTLVAQQFGVHPNTVSKLWRSVREIRDAHSETIDKWRPSIDKACFEAIKRAVLDSANPHKAATTALAWLRGVGILQNDANVTVNLAQIAARIPEDWRDRYIGSANVQGDPPTPIDET